MLTWVQEKIKTSVGWSFPKKVAVVKSKRKILENRGRLSNFSTMWYLYCMHQLVTSELEWKRQLHTSVITEKRRYDRVIVLHKKFFETQSWLARQIYDGFVVCKLDRLES